MEVIHDGPSQSDFVSLSVHQSQTPASFYNGPAILHHLSPLCVLKIGARDLALAPAFSGLAAAGGRSVTNGHVNGHAEGTGVAPSADGVNGEEVEAQEEVEPEVEIPGVDVWITSE